jgi:hypothetical protein
MAIPEIFADTAGWGNLVDSSQKHHALAASIYRETRQQGGKLITTNYILAELIALLSSPLRIPRNQTISFISSIKASPYVEVVHIDAALDLQAWELLRQRPDKEWSLVDCSSFILMRQRGINQAWTHDHHFEQAGFVRLLRD